MRATFLFEFSVKEFFAYGVSPKSGSYYLRYKLAKNINIEDIVLSYPNGPGFAAEAIAAEVTAPNEPSLWRIKINNCSSYVALNTSNIPQKTFLSKNILSRAPTNLCYNEKLNFTKDVNTRQKQTFEPG